MWGAAARRCMAGHGCGALTTGPLFEVSAHPHNLRIRRLCVYDRLVEANPTPAHPLPTEVGAGQLDAVRMCLDAASGRLAVDALPHLRKAADQLADLLDETMAAAVLNGQASLRSAAHQAGLTDNAVGPRLARTQTLGAYADPRGRVTADGVRRARYDHESGTPRHAPKTTTAMRFKPRRST